MFKRLPALALLACGLITLAACKKSPPANVAATVNNRVITYADLDKQYAAAQLPPPEGEEVADSIAVARLEVLRTLIDNEVMLQRAEKLGLMAQEADVEAKFNELKALSTEEEFKKQLASKKLTAEELKAQVRRDLSVQRLFNKEITSHITITDKDVTDFYNANRQTLFNLAEPQIHLAQILVTPAPNAEVRNLKGDKAQNPAEAKKKIQMLVNRLKQGEDFAMLAQNYSEDPESAPNGGDLGFIPESAFEKTSVELRKVVMQLQSGQISPIIPTLEGFRVLKVISKESAGQRELNDPRVQQSIRETLLNRRDSLYKAAYFETARDEAKIVNYYATSILGKMQATK